MHTDDDAGLLSFRRDRLECYAVNVTAHRRPRAEAMSGQDYGTLSSNDLRVGR